MCDNTNTADLDDKHPQCGAVGCEHVMCAKCVQLTDEDLEDEERIKYGGAIGYWGRTVAGLSGRAPSWYCVSVTEE